MPQLSKAEGLRAVVDRLLGDKDKDVVEKAKKWAALPTSRLEPLGEDIKRAIEGLKPDRCNELTVHEIAAFMMASQKTAETHLGLYIDHETEGVGYHLANIHLGKYARWHYHLEPFRVFHEAWMENQSEQKSIQGAKSWQSPAGILRSQGKKRNEAARQADIFARAVRVALADRPDLHGPVEEIEAIFRQHGLTLAALPAFTAFLHAQVTDITTTVQVSQPWITDEAGRVLDHAWWLIDHDATQIRDALQIGGRITPMPLVTALREDWIGGDAWFVWKHIADHAAERWQTELVLRLPEMRLKAASELEGPQRHKNVVRGRT